MHKIIRKRGAGKTTDLIRKSAETGTYILCANRKRALHIQKMADHLGLKIPFPVTVQEYFMSDGFLNSYIKSVYIDDADDVLQTVFNKVDIEIITMRE